MRIGILDCGHWMIASWADGVIPPDFREHEFCSRHDNNGTPGCMIVGAIFIEPTPEFHEWLNQRAQRMGQ